MIIIEIEIIEGEAAAEAEGDPNVIDTMRGREIIIEAAVVAWALIITEVMVKAEAMMMNARGAEAAPLTGNFNSLP